MDNIPKIIHYCWFGRGDMPQDAVQFIEGWKKLCPQYQIKEWNEYNFDITSNRYVKEAYEAKKYAFVTDYVRLYALYNEGGIYMDTDVELLKPLDIFLKHNAFSSFENSNLIPTGLMAAKKGSKWIKDLLDEYDNISFIKPDGSYDTTTNVIRITNLTEKKYGLVKESSYQDLGEVTLYPHEYFCPKDWHTGNIHITENTYAIHHFKGSWHSEQDKKKIAMKDKLIKKYGKEKGLKIFRARDKLLRRLAYIIHPRLFLQKIIKKR